MAIDVARSTAKIPETVARSYAQAKTKGARKAAGLPDDFDLSSGPVKDPIRRFAYGEGPVETYQKRAKGNKEKLEKTPFKGVAGPLSFLGLAATVGSDVTGVPGKKQLTETLAKEVTEQGVKRALKKAGKDISDDAIRAIANTKDRNVINKIVEQSAPSSNTVTQPLPDLVPPTPVRPPVPPAGQRSATDIIDATVPKVRPVETGELIPPQSVDPFDDILGAVRGKPAAPGQKPVKGIATARKEQTALLSKERGQRFAESKKAGTQADGSAGYFAEKSKLKGEYTKVDYNTLMDDIGPQRAEELFTSARQRIQAVPDETYRGIGLHPQAARLNTQTAVRKVIGLEPGLPTKSEIKLLQIVSPKLAAEAEATIPKHRKLFDFAAQLAGFPRAIKSSFDFSMGGRQGLFVAARHPVVWARANKESVKFAKDSKYYDKVMDGIRNSDEYLAGEKYGLSLPAAKFGREEAYAGAELAEKIPTIKRFERAYNGGLTKMRYDLWKQHIDALGGADEAERAIGPKGMQGLAEAINTLTGRGGKAGGFISRNAETLSTTLFSPRLWASRLENFNPRYWKRLGPVGRKEALESMGSFAALAGLVLGAAVVAGADVETDPRSADFLKIKVGDTRYDILGGEQQNLVFAHRFITGQTKNSQSGAIRKVNDGFGAPTRLSFAGDVLRNKTNPTVGTALTLIEGEDKAGNKANVDSLNPFENEITKLFLPINLEGAYDTIKNEGSVAEGLAKNAPNFVGIGTQTYGLKDVNLTDKQKAKVEGIKDSKQKEAYASFYQTAKVASGRRKNVLDEIKKVIATDEERAIKLAQEYNAQYASAFKDWKSKNKQYADDELTKEYASNKITDATLERIIKSLEEDE